MTLTAVTTVEIVAVLEKLQRLDAEVGVAADRASALEVEAHTEHVRAYALREERTKAFNELKQLLGMRNN